MPLYSLAQEYSVANWKESEHPRDKDGKFTNKGAQQAFGVVKKIKAISDKRKAQKDIAKNNKKSYNIEKPIPVGEINGIAFYQNNEKDFHKSLQAAYESIDIDKRWRVTVHKSEYYKGSKLYVTKGGSCVAVTPEGDIISVCKNQLGGEHGVAKVLLQKAVREGGKKLDAYGRKLYDFYTKNGFEPVSWTEWNGEYAPEDWKKAKEQGLSVEEEPVIFYKYTGKKTNETYEEFLSRVKASPGYNEAQKQRDEEV